MAERLPTGIDTLDEMLDGGIRQGDVVLLSGGPGTGKTVFSSQFLWTGLEDGETAAFFTTEEHPGSIRENVTDFGIDFEGYEESGDLRIEFLQPPQKAKFVTRSVKSVLEDEEPDRVVVDSLSVMEDQWSSNLRTNLNKLMNILRESDTTAIVTAEAVGEEANRYSRHRVAEFVADGIISLTGLSLGQMQYRSLQIIKMRGTDFVEETAELSFGENGIELSLEEGIG